MENPEKGNKNKHKKNKSKSNTKATTQSDQDNTKEHKETRIQFKKRKGTSGFTGQLYESKLLSLVLLRCLTDNEVEDFLLGSNVDGVGDLDDICLRFTYKNKAVAAFIQSTHKDHASKGIADSNLYNPNSKVNLFKCFDSYLQVLNKFVTDDSDIFNGDFRDLTFHFVIYTSAVNKISKEKIKQVDEKHSDTFAKVRQLISFKGHDTNSGDIFQIEFDDKDKYLLSNNLINKEIDMIAKHLVSFFDKNGKKNYDIFKKYVNILVPDVITLTENDDYYDASVNPEVFKAKDKILVNLKYKIFEEILSVSQVDTQYLLTNLQLLLNSDDESSRQTHLSRLILRYVVFNEVSKKLAFNTEVKENIINKFKKQLEQLQVSEELVKKALEEAGIEILNSDSVQFKIPKHEIDLNEIKECNDKKSLFNTEINMAKDFMSRLYFYTNQGQEKDVDEKLISEISQYYKNSGNSTSRADLASLKFHDKVQKWWLLDEESFFLTNTCDYLGKLVFEINQNFIDMLSFHFEHDTKRYSVQFLPQAMNCFERINEEQNKIINIITRSSLLTTKKLKQLFSGACVFIDHKYLYNLRANEWELVVEELKNKKNTVLVMVCNKFEESQKDIAMVIMEKIINAFAGKIVIVSNETLADVNNDRIEINDTIIDENNTLSDMSIETRKELLEHEVNFQGFQVNLKYLVNTDCYDINSEIVHKMFKNETIIIGHSLSNFDYESIKDYYVPRTFLSQIDENFGQRYFNFRNPEYKCEFKLDTFKDMPKNINIITGDPGMGKSTILTHLSLESKKVCPQKWILRMNLLDYTDEFQKLGPEVNPNEFMKLILKSEFDDISNFSIKEVGGNLVVEYTGNDDDVAFSVKVLMNCYRKGDIIFIFDGFDEICPDYQTQVTSFIKNIDYDHLREGDKYNSSLYLSELLYPIETNRFQIWITSRPYNLIIQHLEYEFGAPLMLKPLTSKEQNEYYNKYWQLSLNPQDFDVAQFNNIKSFLDFMAQFAKDVVNSMEHVVAAAIPLYQMYVSAARYLKIILLAMPSHIDRKEVLTLFFQGWVSYDEHKLRRSIAEYVEREKHKISQILEGVPLFMEMAAYYLVNAIKRKGPTAHSDWDLGYTTINYYKRYVELKLKVRFENKNNLDPSKPDVKAIFDNVHARFINIHKKLAFYAMFHESDYLKKLLTKEDLQDIEVTMQNIKDGKEKSGLIERINNQVPRFNHLTFAEFFAIEFIVDVIMTKPQLIKTTMDLILNFLMKKCSLGLMTIFDQKLKYESTELRKTLDKPSVKKVVFELMWEQKDWKQFPDPSVLNSGSFRNFEDLCRKLGPALDKAVDNNLANITMFLLRSVDGNLTKDNVQTFIIEVLNTGFFFESMLLNRPQLVEYVLNMIREVDVVYIKTLLRICKLEVEEEKVRTMNNEEILEAILKEAEKWR